MSSPIDKARAKLAYWKQKFLDLSNRNSQLNFKPQKKRYIEFFHPDMETIFKVLVVLGQTMEFIPANIPFVGKKKKKPPLEKIEEDIEELKTNTRLTQLLVARSTKNLRRELDKIERKANT